jgi:hypothetical protein
MAKPKRGKARKNGRVDLEDDGPLEWLAPLVEETYYRLAPRGSATPAPPKRKPVAGKSYRSTHVRGAGESLLVKPDQSVWTNRLREFKGRKAATRPRKNWRPLGPMQVLNGQTEGNQPVAGRVSGMAIAPGGRTVYAATACGGVFRSDNGGASWRSLMNGFDRNPTQFASSSLACGAIAIDPNDPQRVYVGTGEGDTHNLFRRRIVNALPAFRGIGPIRSDNGGRTWIIEPTARGSPDLAGDAFFALAVDPANRNNVVAGTIRGLYQRVRTRDRRFAWTLRKQGVYSSVIAVSSGRTRRFFAAKWGGGVFQSDDGNDWTSTGTGFPRADVGRIALAAQPNNLDVLYAFVATDEGGVNGVYRLSSGVWKECENPPNALPGFQGDYDLTITVDPEDIDLIYLGGDRGRVDPFPGSVWRCVVRQVGSRFLITDRTSIGTHAHADIHVLVHTPGKPHELWCGCDGGVFLNRNPRRTGRFMSRNNGLSCLCCNFIAQHPDDAHILFTGLQDNGTARMAAGSRWTRVQGGDGGYCVVNWADPDKVLAFQGGTVFRSIRGGKTQASFRRVMEQDTVTMTQPIVSAPYNPSSPEDADFVAIGRGNRVFISSNFGHRWPKQMQIKLPLKTSRVFALAFASTSRLFIGTTKGVVFRADRSGQRWSYIRLDKGKGGAPLGVKGLITDIAVDWSDHDRASVYVVFGGMGVRDRPHVWRFDGNGWKARSGKGRNRLLNVEHTALVVDPKKQDHLYVGADIGVWYSDDAGRTWTVMENGLPDASIFDLQLHPTRRLLRAATHGRGVYEIRV